MTKDEIIEGLEKTKDLLAEKLPGLIAWDAIKTVTEAIGFMRDTAILVK